MKRHFLPDLLLLSDRPRPPRKPGDSGTLLSLAWPLLRLLRSRLQQKKENVKTKQQTAGRSWYWPSHVTVSVTSANSKWMQTKKNKRTFSVNLTFTCFCLHFASTSIDVSASRFSCLVSRTIHSLLSLHTRLAFISTNLLIYSLHTLHALAFYI